MANIVDSIGADLEQVHTGLIVFLVDLWREGKREPLQTFFSELGVNLDGARELRAKKEHEKIDLVLIDNGDSVLVAIEMKVHNHESCINEKKPRTGRSYQTVEYPKRVQARHFLYVTLGTGEFYRREPYGRKVQQVGLEKFLTAVKKIANYDPLFEAWEKTLSSESEFRTAYQECSRHRGKDVKKSNIYFLGFLRHELDNGQFRLGDADLTAYRLSQDTILNVGIERPPEIGGAYCYMEINGNGKLNLKANLDSFGSLEEKRDYVDRAKDYYEGLVNEQWDCEPTDKITNLKKSRMLLSFDVGIEKQNGFFKHTQSREHSCEKISEVVCWFSDKPAISLSSLR